MNASTIKKYLPLVVVAIISSVITSIVVVSYGFPERKGDTAVAVSPARCLKLQRKPAIHSRRRGESGAGCSQDRH